MIVKSRYLVLLTTFMANFIVDGYLFAIGLPIIELEREYSDVREELIALMGGVYPTLYCLLSPVAMSLLQCIGLRKVIIAGCLIQMIGFTMALCNHWLRAGFWFDALSLGVIPGIGASLLMGPPIAGVIKYFQNSMEKATGVTTAGSPTGALVYGFTYSFFAGAPTFFGWRLVIIFYGSLAAITLVFASCFIYETDNKENEQTKTGSSSTVSKFISAMRNQFSPEIWNEHNWVYFMFLLATTFSILGYPVPTLLIPGQAKKAACLYEINAGNGTTTTQPISCVTPWVRNNLVTMWGIANLLSRVLTGIISAQAHRAKICTSFSLYVLSFLLSALVVFLFPHVMSGGDVIFALFMTLYGLFCAPFVSLRSVYLNDVFYKNTSLVEAAFGWQLCVDAVFAWVGFYVATYLNTISPLHAYNFTGLAFIAGAVCVLLTYSPYFKSYTDRNRFKEEQSEVKQKLASSKTDHKSINY